MTFLREMSTSVHQDNLLEYVNQSFVNIDGMRDALENIEGKIANKEGFTFFTMNLDHLYKLKRFPNFRGIYESGTFVSADGWPIALVAQRRRAKGSELIFPICALSQRDPLKLFLFGSTAEALAITAKKLTDRYPDLNIVGRFAPPLRFDPYSQVAHEAVDQIKESGADICFVALGAPTQEAFSVFAKERCTKTGFICVGAALDFIAGTQRRAPRIIQILYLEWAWRWLSSPRRLSKRYLQCILVFIQLLTEKLHQIFR